MPIMVAQITMPESEIATLLAIDAFKNGYAEAPQFDCMLDVRDLLLLGASAKQDKGVLGVCKIAGVALWNIKDTYNGKTFQPQEEEIKTLSMLADISKEFWSRQSGSLYRMAYKTLRDWREQQTREKQNEDKSDARRAH